MCGPLLKTWQFFIEPFPQSTEVARSVTHIGHGAEQAVDWFGFLNHHITEYWSFVQTWILCFVPLRDNQFRITVSKTGFRKMMYRFFLKIQALILQKLTDFCKLFYPFMAFQWRPFHIGKFDDTAKLELCICIYRLLVLLTNCKTG